jgi:peptide/nickel transport system permease protein
MRAYIIRRILILIPTLLLVTFAIFCLLRFVPGDVIDSMLADAAGELTLDREEVEKDLGLDQPLLVQYGRWLGVIPRANGRFSGIFQGDLGGSWWHSGTVTSLILKRWPVTVELGLMALVISQLIALPIGIYSALRQDKWPDYLGRSLAILLISVPGFWVGTMVIVFPSIWWGYMPPITFTPLFEDPLRNLRMFVIPAVVLGMAMSGLSMRMTRTMMLEVLRQDYIRTAWSKGLKEREVVVRHSLKNALIPVVTIVGLQMPVLIGGTVIIEQIFSLPGMGRLILDATAHRDYPLMSGVMLFFGAVLVFINLVVDLTYSFLDPRIRYR